jgi:hypothetical protein
VSNLGPALSVMLILDERLLGGMRCRRSGKSSTPMPRFAKGNSVKVIAFDAEYGAVAE